jgi:Fe-S cluster assembly protein SufD
VITATQQLETYLESFSEFEKLAAGNDLPWLRKLRRDAFARFCEVGFPTTHDEDWRFTNVSAIAQTAFRLTCNRRVRLSQQELKPYRVAGVACQLVFVNGHFARELSLLGKLPNGVKVSSLAGEISSNPGAIEPHLGRYLDVRRDAFCALNTAFVEDGASVRIPRGTLVEEPICSPVCLDCGRCSIHEPSAQPHCGGVKTARPRSSRTMCRSTAARCSATRSRNWSPATTLCFRTT